MSLLMLKAYSVTSGENLGTSSLPPPIVTSTLRSLNLGTGFRAGAEIGVSVGITGVVTPHALNTKLMMVNRIPTTNTLCFITFLHWRKSLDIKALQDVDVVTKTQDPLFCLQFYSFLLYPIQPPGYGLFDILCKPLLWKYLINGNIAQVQYGKRKDAHFLIIVQRHQSCKYKSLLDSMLLHRIWIF